MKYLLVMFEEEVFPCDRWGTSGSRSEFEIKEYDSSYYENVQQAIAESIACFKARNPNARISLHEIVDNNRLLDIEVNGYKLANDIVKKKEEEEKAKRIKEKQVLAERYKEEELAQLAKLKKKYETL